MLRVSRFPPTWFALAIAPTVLGVATRAIALPLEPLWTPDGVRVCGAVADQQYPVIASDRSGGALIAWQDGRGGVFVTRVGSSGEPVAGWPLDGVQALSGGDPTIASDGQGGTYVAATTAVAHLLGNGLLAGSTSVAKGATSSADKIDTWLPAVASDANGAAWFTYEDDYPAYGTVHLSRVNVDGTLGGSSSWTEWSGRIMAPLILPDSHDGAFLAWHRCDAAVVAHVGPDGQASWDQPVRIVTTVGCTEGIGIVSDGAGGVIVAWIITGGARDGSGQAFAQRITAEGAIADGWPAAGRQLSQTPGVAGTWRFPDYGVSASFSSIVSDGAGGAFVAWSNAQEPGGGDIYAQHVTSGGAIASGWPSAGLAVCTARGNQSLPSLAADGAGGAFVFWQDSRGASQDIHATHLDADAGTNEFEWSEALCTAPSTQWMPRAASSNADEAIVVWQDDRDGDANVYAARVKRAGAASALATWVAAESYPGVARLSWHAKDPVAQYTVYRRAPGEDWAALGTHVPDPAGTLVYEDHEIASASTVEYRLGIRLGALEEILTSRSLVVRPSPSVLASESFPGAARVVWQVSPADGNVYTVYREEVGGTWSALSSVQPTESGAIEFIDRGVAGGGTYSYRLEVRQGAFTEAFGEVSIQVPAAPTLVSASAEPAAATLKWQASSRDVSFTVQRRREGSAWRDLASVTPDETNAIVYRDQDIRIADRYAYRLVARRGTFEGFYGETSVRIEMPVLALHVVGANPIRGDIQLAISLSETAPATLELVDVAGRLVSRQSVDGFGLGAHALFVKPRPLSGVYFARLRQSGKTLTRKVEVLP